MGWKNDETTRCGEKWNDDEGERMKNKSNKGKCKTLNKERIKVMKNEKDINFDLEKNFMDTFKELSQKMELSESIFFVQKERKFFFFF